MTLSGDNSRLAASNPLGSLKAECNGGNGLSRVSQEIMQSFCQLLTAGQKFIPGTELTIKNIEG